MTPDQLADRIMARIERDQAIHKSSIAEELQLACAPVMQVTQRDGYPVQSEAGSVVFCAYDADRQRLRDEWEAFFLGSVWSDDEKKKMAGLPKKALSINRIFRGNGVSK